MLTNSLKARRSPDITESTFSCSRVSHGFMANQDTVRHYARHLAEIGYAAYCFDFNGGSVMGSKSTGKTTDMSVLTEVMDLEVVIDHVLQLPHIDGDKGVVLMGCSQGGFVSALTAAKRKEQVSQLVLFYPALCIPDDARTGKRCSPDLIRTMFRRGSTAVQ